MKTREIKYKSLYRGTWYQVKELWLCNGAITPTQFEGENFSPDSEHVKCTVQFTGLTDNNEKEIYEGDIIKCSAGENDSIVFYEGCFRLKKRTVTIDWFTNELDQELEIIGNIYENPSLL